MNDVGRLVVAVLVVHAAAAVHGGGLGPFTDHTDVLGIGDTEHRHFAVCVVDINQDGWVDLYYANGWGNPSLPVPPSGICPDLTDGDPPFLPETVNVCFLNRGDGTFGPNIAPAAGVDDYWNAMRHVFGDYDNDGRRDLISHNFIRSPFYRAVSGPDPLVFEDASEDTGLLVCLKKGTGASWVDLDNDGWLDLYAVEYDVDRLAVEHVNVMYRNNGDGTFTEITEEAGVDLPDNPMGIACADYDNDGDQDIFVSNSHEAPSRLYRNDGVDAESGIPHFTDVAPAAGVAVVGGPNNYRGFGAAWGDYNNDGRLDLLFLREFDSRLYRNDGPNVDGLWTFTDVTGVGGMDLFQSAPFASGAFADLNNDGWLDILLAAGPLFGNFDAAERVYLNNGDGTWQDVAAQVGMTLTEYEIIGVIPADIDNDGDLDVLWTGRGLEQPNFLFRNETVGDTWIQFRLTGTVSNRDAVGARIEVTATLVPGGDPVTQIREVIAGTGFFDDVPRIQTFGLGEAAFVSQAVVRWPNGLVQHLGPLPINQRHDVTEPVTPGDLNTDGVVSTADLLQLIGAWGPCGNCDDCPEDLDGNCVVATNDLLILIGNWG